MFPTLSTSAFNLGTLKDAAIISQKLAAKLVTLDTIFYLTAFVILTLSPLKIAVLSEQEMAHAANVSKVSISSMENVNSLT